MSVVVVVGKHNSSAHSLLHHYITALAPRIVEFICPVRSPELIESRRRFELRASFPPPLFE